MKLDGDRVLVIGDLLSGPAYHCMECFVRRQLVSARIVIAKSHMAQLMTVLSFSASTTSERR